jgi:hypothetical protein
MSTDRYRKLAIFLLSLAGRRKYDQELSTTANYGALVGFLDALSDEDFRYFAGHLLHRSTPSRSEATRRIVMTPSLPAQLEDLILTLSSNTQRREVNR